MKHIIVAVRDRQLDAFMRPFTAATIGQAVRAFSDEVNRQGSELNQHPEDYELYQIGEFDDDTGGLLQPSSVKSIAIASNLIERK